MFQPPSHEALSQKELTRKTTSNVQFLRMKIDLTRAQAQTVFAEFIKHNFYRKLTNQIERITVIITLIYLAFYISL